MNLFNADANELLELKNTATLIAVDDAVSI